MFNFSMRRLAVSSALTAAVLAGTMLPASTAFAEDTAVPDVPVACDQAALDADVVQALTDARIAQKAYTVHTRTAQKALFAKLKSTEAREARAAARAAHRAEVKAARTALVAARAARHSDKETRAAARAVAAKAKADFRAAAAVARVERREARKVAHASTAQLRGLIKVERRALKKAWNTAKSELHAAREAAEDCRNTPAPVEPAPAV